MHRLLALLLFSPPALAGFFELGASANYRATNYDKHNYVQGTSYTASLSYYFFAMCAVEFNYTNDYSKQVSKGPSVTDQMTKIEDLSVFTSADLVLSLAEREDFFRPFVKLGGGYLIKDRYRRIDFDAKTRLSRQEGLVPSGGVGLAIGVTQNLNLKLGVDAWTSPLNFKPRVIDYAGRAGVAWIF